MGKLNDLLSSVLHLSLPRLLSLSLRACAGLPPLNHMLLEHKVPSLMQATPITTPLTTPTEVPVKKPIISAIPRHANGHMTNGMMMNGTGNEIPH